MPITTCSGCVRMRSDQLMQPADPCQPLRQPLRSQSSTGLIHHINIVMVFRPVIADENHLLDLPSTQLVPEPGGHQTATQWISARPWHDIPSALKGDLTNRPGHDPAQGIGPTSRAYLESAHRPAGSRISFTDKERNLNDAPIQSHWGHASAGKWKSPPSRRFGTLCVLGERSTDARSSTDVRRGLSRCRRRRQPRHVSSIYLFQSNAGSATREQLLPVMSPKMVSAHVKTGAIVRAWHGLYASSPPSTVDKTRGTGSGDRQDGRGVHGRSRTTVRI